jgi:hypothetical protein
MLATLNALTVRRYLVSACFSRGNDNHHGVSSLTKDITSHQTLEMEYVVGILGRAGNKVHRRSISLGI